jgi:hypothetical protein
MSYHSVNLQVNTTWVKTMNVVYTPESFFSCQLLIMISLSSFYNNHYPESFGNNFIASLYSFAT